MTRILSLGIALSLLATSGGLHLAKSDFPEPTLIEVPAEIKDAPKVVATYAGSGGQDVIQMQYVDGAVMLGLSLARHAPDIPRVCLVLNDMSSEKREVLRNANWHVLEVPGWKPGKFYEGTSINDRKAWNDAYEKIDVWRLPFEKVLYLDADTYVLNDDIQQLDWDLEDGYIGMVQDCCKPWHPNLAKRSSETLQVDIEDGQFNTGVMLLHPDLNQYKTIRNAMSSASGLAVLDQTHINMVFEGKVKSLDHKYNVHGYPPGSQALDLPGSSKSSPYCNQTVIAHFTGGKKPTANKATYAGMQWQGVHGMPYLQCMDVYLEFFSDMYDNRKSLSQVLQQTIREEPDDWQPGNTIWSVEGKYIQYLGFTTQKIWGGQKDSDLRGVPVNNQYGYPLNASLSTNSSEWNADVIRELIAADTGMTRGSLNSIERTVRLLKQNESNNSTSNS